MTAIKFGWSDFWFCVSYIMWREATKEEGWAEAAVLAILALVSAGIAIALAHFVCWIARRYKITRVQP